MTKEFKYIFGPVPSRRLGRSLGIDLVPYKTCSFDCVYCQIESTTDLTVERKEYVPEAEVIAELKEKIESGAAIDFLTFSGSGEPTLHSGLGRLIKYAKKFPGLKTAVITNGSLLWRKDVASDLVEADVALPTLSSVNEESFKRIHRPCPELQLPRIVDGLVEFRKNFKGEIWLEVFIVKGINDTEAEMRALAETVKKINPDRVQLNTSARIPSEEFSLSADQEQMEKLAKILGDRAEVIADFRARHDSKKSGATEDDVLNYLKRRPGTVEDIAEGLNIPLELAEQHLAGLLEKKRITGRQWQGRKEFTAIK
jgi:wyosine [tRNA(Phe)-imidazoG37] synthetase (radical SAM superfamily)